MTINGDAHRTIDPNNNNVTINSDTENNTKLDPDTNQKIDINIDRDIKIKYNAGVHDEDVYTMKKNIDSKIIDDSIKNIELVENEVRSGRARHLRRTRAGRVPVPAGALFVRG